MADKQAETFSHSLLAKVKWFCWLTPNRTQTGFLVFPRKSLCHSVQCLFSLWNLAHNMWRCKPSSLWPDKCTKLIRRFRFPWAVCLRFFCSDSNICPILSFVSTGNVCLLLNDNISSQRDLLTSNKQIHTDKCWNLLSVVYMFTFTIHIILLYPGLPKLLLVMFS